jgi:hypothetical protein
MEARMVRKPYGSDLEIASPVHGACEARVQFLARAAAELAEFYEGINFTLKRQRDAANAELRKLKGAA